MVAADSTLGRSTALVEHPITFSDMAGSWGVGESPEPLERSLGSMSAVAKGSENPPLDMSTSETDGILHRFERAVFVEKDR
jgi:hypothetical protein